MNLSPGDQIDLCIHDIAQEGRWVGRSDSGQVVFVRGEIVPGERIRARVSAVKKSFVEADLLEILEKAPSRVKPPCPYFGKCGGCQLQHMRYAEQLSIKKKMIRDALERLGRFSSPPVKDVCASDEEYGFRNKIEMVFTKNGRLAFHGYGEGRPLVVAEQCLLAPAILNRLLDVTTRYFSGLEASERQACGLRRIMLRRADLDGGVMVAIEMRRAPAQILQNYVENILRVSGKDRTTIVAVTGDDKSGLQRQALHGSGVLEEKLGRFKFIIAPDSFFQTCTRQAEKLCEAVVGMSLGGKLDLALDLFCGTGPMAHYLSEACAEVIGVDGQKSAIENAEANARRNGCTSIRFVAQALDRIADLRTAARPDLVVMDPPRNGIHAEALRGIKNLQAKKIIYVSCNPATFARDARLICEDGLYNLVRVQPVDMFPQTSHVETVSLFMKEN